MRLLSYKLGCKERLQLDQRQVREAKKKGKAMKVAKDVDKENEKAC